LARLLGGLAGAVCIVCAILVSTSAVSLKERQQTNQALDRQRNVLYVTGLASPADGLGRDAVIALFTERAKPVWLSVRSLARLGDPVRRTRHCRFRS